MSSPTFGECFCAKHNIPRSEYARAVLARALYRRTRPFKWLLPLFTRDYFAADFDLIYGVEHLRRVRDFVPEAERFNEHPANRGWLRRTLCLRVSTARLKALIRETLPPKVAAGGSGQPEEGGTAMPFDMKTPSRG